MTKHRNAMWELIKAATEGKIRGGAQMMVTEKTIEEVKDQTGVDISAIPGFGLAHPPAEDPNDGDEHIIVCVPKDPDDEMIMPDNLLSECAWCGRTVQHRPNIPKWLKRVCVPCTLQRATQQDN